MGSGSTGERYTIIRVPFHELYNKYQHLWLDNFNESGYLPDYDFNLDIERYKLLEARGYMFIAGVCLEGEVVGYAAVVTDKFLHSKHVSFAKVDTIYIDKKHRNLKVIRDLLNYVETTLKMYNIKHLFISSMAKRSVGKLLERLKYEPVEMIYGKEL